MRLATASEAGAALDEAFEAADVRRGLEAAAAAGFDAVRLAALARAAANDDPRRDEWRRLTEQAADGEDGSAGLGRLALLCLARTTLADVARLRVDAAVRDHLYGDFRMVAQPRPRQRRLFDPASKTFATQARLLTFRRLPAGQLDFEVSGFPRSWLPKVPLHRLPATLAYIGRMGGFAPLYETHIATRWAAPVALLRDEDLASCRRIARTMRCNPEVRGLMSSSWLNDPMIARTDPHLAWRFDRIEAGAFLTTAGPAPADSGADVGNPERRRLIEAGRWRPRTGVMLWARRPLLAWETQGGD